MIHLPLHQINTSALLRTYVSDPASIFPAWHDAVTNCMPKPPTKPCVVTGQQVGLFGGPLYTLLKIASARRYAANLSAELATEVRTVFWLEDNDHDAQEASTTWVPAPDGSLQRIAAWDGSGGRTPVSGRTFSAEEIGKVEHGITALDGRFAEETRTRLRNIYAEGRLWTDAFLDVLAPYLSVWNVEVVRGSHIVEQGSHRGLLLSDLEREDIVSAIHTRSALLQSKGFGVQASLPDLLFFLHVDGQRVKLVRTSDGFRSSDGTVWNSADILGLARDFPHRFSPNVLGRPLLQDTVLPTVINVLGVAELSYHAQLVSAYQVANRVQPQARLRHHACLLDAKAERLLDKLGMSATDLFAPWEEVQARALAAEISELASDLDSSMLLEAMMKPYREAAEALDASLVKSVAATRATIQGSLDALAGKLKSAVKRREQERLDRLRFAWWSVFPNGTPNERVAPLAVWEARLGFDVMRTFAEFLSLQDPAHFTIAGPSDLPLTT